MLPKVPVRESFVSAGRLRPQRFVQPGVVEQDVLQPALHSCSVNQRPKLSTCQRPKLSSLATFLGAAFMVFEAIRVIAGFQDVAMMGNAIQ